MNADLRNFLADEADAVDLDGVPPVAALSAGRRRLRRRRTATTAAVAAVAGIAVVAPLALRAGEPAQPDLAGPAPAAADLVWARGAVIHDQGHELHLDHRVRAFVTTPSGFVVADSTGAVLLVDDSGSTQIGQVREARTPQLASDGSLVAWIGTSAGGAAVMTDDVSDAVPAQPRTMTSLRRPGTRKPFLLADVDGDQVYVGGLGGWSRFAPGGEVTHLPGVGADGEKDPMIIDVRNGRVHSARGSDFWVATDAVAGDRVPLPGRLSPDGSSLAVGSQDGVQVVDLATGSVTAYDTPSGIGGSWVRSWPRPDTIVTIAGESPEEPYDVLICTVSTTSCEVALADVRFDDGIVLPDTSPIM